MKKEDDIVLETLFFDFFVKNKENTILELEITPDCNQHCAYCYLEKNKEKLYPKELRNNDNILHNLKILLDYLQSRNSFFSKISLYSGEIWESNFAKNIFDIIFDCLSNYHMTDYITIPSNMSFLLKPEIEEYYDNLIKKFKDINVNIIFSASIDGKFLDPDNRQRNNFSIYTDEFYNKVFYFCKKHNFGFHPMVSALQLDKWINNFDWFMEKIKDFNFTNKALMMLEVRDDNWTEESILNLLNLLDHEIDWFLENEFHNNKEDFFTALLSISNKEESFPQIISNILLLDYGNKYTCSIQSGLIVRLGDLSWVPCHRTSYPQFNYGQFIVENEKITSIKANNPELALIIYCSNPNTAHIKCDTCKYQYFCFKGCLGSQFETNNNLFVPCTSVCNMVQSKISFLIQKYNSLGFFEWLQNEFPGYNDYYKTMIKEVESIVEYFNKIAATMD